MSICLRSYPPSRSARMCTGGQGRCMLVASETCRVLTPRDPTSLQMCCSQLVTIFVNYFSNIDYSGLCSEGFLNLAMAKPCALANALSPSLLAFRVTDFPASIFESTFPHSCMCVCVRHKRQRIQGFEKSSWAKSMQPDRPTHETATPDGRGQCRTVVCVMS